MEKKEVLTKPATRQVYADLLNDFMFKRIFGSENSKDVLIAFLNEILQDVEIEDVEFIPTYHLGETQTDRKAVFDISCKCRDGRTFIVEMQKGRQRHFTDRALFYTSYPIHEQGRLAWEEYEQRKTKGEETGEFHWDYKLHPVVVVAILNFSVQHLDDWPEQQCRSSYRIREDITHETMTDNLRFVFLELGRFKKELWGLETSLDKWMYLFKNMSKLMERPDILFEPEFESLFNLAKIANFTPDDYKSYQESMKVMSDYYNTIEYAEEKAYTRGHKNGLEEGIEKGLQQGREEGLKDGLEQGRIEMAQKMLAKGMAVSDIAELTSLSKEEVLALTKK